MRAPTFRTKREIEEAAVAVSELMCSWGFSSRQWMVGKYLSHFFIGMVPKPKDIIRDINLYVLKDKLPWKIKKQSRSIIPPAGRYFDEYNALQNKYRVSLDFMPLPDDYLGASFISRNCEEVVVGGERINLESAEKFIKRLEVLSVDFKGKSAAAFRDFYYADKKRYHDRITFYNQVSRFLRRTHKQNLEKRMQQLTDDYAHLIHWAYPELFEKKKKHVAALAEVSGSSVDASQKTVKGVIALHTADSVLPKKGRKFVYVFTHFFPGDTAVFPHANAIVTDGGGLLSHAAIVCREIGMPCIVGTKNASSVFKDGDKVEMDLEKGVVRKI